MYILRCSTLTLWSFSRPILCGHLAAIWTYQYPFLSTLNFVSIEHCHNLSLPPFICFSIENCYQQTLLSSHISLLFKISNEMQKTYKVAIQQTYTLWSFCRHLNLSISNFLNFELCKHGIILCGQLAVI